MSDKPREFWITESRCTGKQKAHKTQLECWGEIQHNDNEYHVIEYAAFEKLKAELAESEAKYNFMVDSAQQNARERDALKARLKELKEEKILMNHEREEMRVLKAKLAEVEAENERMREQLSDCSALYESTKDTFKELVREREAAKVMREALEFYAERGVWGNGHAEIDPCDQYTCDLGVRRGGKRAIAALSKADEIRGKE